MSETPFSPDTRLKNKTRQTPRQNDRPSTSERMILAARLAEEKEAKERQSMALKEIHKYTKSINTLNKNYFGLLDDLNELTARIGENRVTREKIKNFYRGDAVLIKAGFIPDSHRYIRRRRDDDTDALRDADKLIGRRALKPEETAEISSLGEKLISTGREKDAALDEVQRILLSTENPSITADNILDSDLNTLSTAITDYNRHARLLLELTGSIARENTKNQENSDTKITLDQAVKYIDSRDYDLNDDDDDFIDKNVAKKKRIAKKGEGQVEKPHATQPPEKLPALKDKKRPVERNLIYDAESVYYDSLAYPQLSPEEYLQRVAKSRANGNPELMVKWLRESTAAGIDKLTASNSAAEKENIWKFLNAAELAEQHIIFETAIKSQEYRQMMDAIRTADQKMDVRTLMRLRTNIEQIPENKVGQESKRSFLKNYIELVLNKYRSRLGHELAEITRPLIFEFDTLARIQQKVSARSGDVRAAVTDFTDHEREVASLTLDQSDRLYKILRDTNAEELRQELLSELMDDDCVVALESLTKYLHRDNLKEQGNRHIDRINTNVTTIFNARGDRMEYLPTPETKDDAQAQKEIANYQLISKLRTDNNLPFDFERLLMSDKALTDAALTYPKDKFLSSVSTLARDAVTREEIKLKALLKKDGISVDPETGKVSSWSRFKGFFSGQRPENSPQFRRYQEILKWKEALLRH